ncbi:hypothetical protein BJX66DRAFT_318409 [Aspergillus keveii]|uniref:Zn(2)-C6 fungal-type domain-containing protein n=1 Tax=Aspergillus keveii TaxID=714993 RepID=A0ABR4FJT1_9EURO
MRWSAGWGSACDPCAKAKTRCIRSQGENSEAKCNRCQSLNISCTQQIRKPRKKRRRQTATALPDIAIPHGNTISRTTDSTQSRRGTPPPPPPPVTTGGLNARSNDAAGSDPNVYVAQVRAERSGAFSVPTWLPGFHPFPTPTCTCLGESDGKLEDGLEPTESDETLLSIYRTRLSPQFPFVIIPNDLTANELQRSRPFLAKAIRMVASLRNRRFMWNQSRMLLRQISGSVFMRSDRSLDLLQGIIVFLGFYHYFCFAHGHFNNLAHLASSMVADMRLDRPRARELSRKRYLRGIDPEEPREMSNDERRAILAVWYINSSSAVAFRKVNSPGRHFTEHMARQLHELQERREYETDEVLTQLVCAQRMNEMVAQLHLSDQSVDVRPSLNFWATNLDNLLAEFDDRLGRGGQHKPHGYLVSSHRNFALVQLLERHLVRNLNHAQNYEEAIAALRHAPDYFRTSAEHSGKNAANTALRAWFEHWLTIPVCHFFYMPMSGYLQLMDVTVILLRRARLMLLSRYRVGDSYQPGTEGTNNGTSSTSVGVDPSSSSDDLMLNLLDRLASRFEEARIEMAAAHCSEWTNDFLDLVAWKLRERKACIERWITVLANEANVHSTLSGSGLGAGGSHRPREPRWDEGGAGDSSASAFQNVDEPAEALWLGPLEELLHGGEAFESWL